MTKRNKIKHKDVLIQNVDLGSIVKDLRPDDNDNSYERAISKTLLFSLLGFDDSSQVNKFESKAIPILSNSCNAMREICTEIVEFRKDLKRIRAKEYLDIIKTLAKSITISKDNENDDNRGFLSRLFHRK